MLVKYKGEHYHAINPRKIGHDQYTCDAWGARSGRPIKSEKILDALARRLMRKAVDKKLKE